MSSRVPIKASYTMDLDHASPPRHSWSKLAIWCLIHACASVAVLPFTNWLYFSAPAILFWPPYGATVLGMAALVSIARSEGQLKGLSLALLGLVVAAVWFATMHLLPHGGMLK
jgi:hypothetical protein